MTESGAVRIGVSEEGGTFWTQGEAVAALLERDFGISASLIAAEFASIDNARRLDAGLVELGFMASNWIGRAKDGAAPFDDPIDIRMVAPANSGAMFFIARADSGIRTFRDMIGRRVSIGPTGSGMVQHVHTILDALGVPFAEIEPAYLSFEEGAAALEAGDVDVQWQCPYPNAVMRDLSERADIRVLDYDDGLLDTLLGKVGFYRRAVMPAGVFRGVDANTAQIAVVNVIAAHARTDSALVRKLVLSMVRNAAELAERNPLFRGLDALFEPLRSEGAAALEFGGVPLHDGAVAAYREAGYLG